MRPHILLLTTGGTIASLPTAEGLAPGLDGEALAGLLPQGIMDCYDITIPGYPPPGLLQHPAGGVADHRPPRL